MAETNEERAAARAALSEQQRAAAFSSSMTPADRSAALREGRTPVPPKFILWMVGVFVVLGGGGAILEHYFGNVGQPSATTTTVFTLPATPTTLAGPQLSSSLSALMGLKEIANAQASPFTLRDQANREWGLLRAKGKVVVLTFYNVNCNDVCPVVGAEIRQAQARLGANARKVEFVIVNSDPNHFAVSAAPAALSIPGLANTPSVYFLTGPLLQLNAVWINYGVSVKVGALASQVAHNNIMYFIDPRGRLRAQAVPFGNENHAGVFSLGPTTISRFAQGIAQTADSLVR